jgi:DNA-binding LacI/PurR family transcriptional regulator
MLHKMRYAPGMPRRTTMPDVARVAGVSVMTVSYTYNQPDRVASTTRERVLQAAAQLGYPGPNAAARNLRSGRTGNLGVILGEQLTYAFGDPQAAAFLAGIAEVCTEHGLGLTLIPISGGPADAERVRQAAVDGLVVWTTTDDDPVLAAAVAARLPAVVHGGPAVEGLHLVTIDNHAAAAAIGAVGLRGATRPAVLSFPLNHRRKANLVVGPDPDSAAFPVTRDRLAGYREAVTSAGLNWADVPVAVLARNDSTEAEHALKQLPSDTDTVLAMSDELALAILRTTTQTVPDQLAVTGWDNTTAAAEAGLTTVAQSLHDQGRRCARLVVGDPPGPEPSWTVVTRDSTR